MIKIYNFLKNKIIKVIINNHTKLNNIIKFSFHNKINNIIIIINNKLNQKII